MADDEKSHVYGLRDGREEECRYFYVGSTKHTTKHRLMSHWAQLKRNKNLHFVRTMNRIERAHVVCDTLATVPRDRQFTVEVEWINRLEIEGHNLTNLSREIHAATVNAQEEYGARLCTPGFFRAHIHLLSGPHIAADPRDQLLVEALAKSLNLTWAIIQKRFPGELKAFLGCKA